MSLHVMDTDKLWNQAIAHVMPNNHLSALPANYILD
jgi:hypothetical protein